jgi:N-acetylornithine carbamoyltransferase
MKHWVSMTDWTPGEVVGLLDRAAALKAGSAAKGIPGKILIALFFNPSLRTRVSFEAAMHRFGGHVITLSPGADAWRLEFADGALMDGDRAEHVKEAARVLSRYGDALAVRSFAGLQEFEADQRDEVIHSFRRHATVPVINMESAVEHPCQGVADVLTIREKLDAAPGRHFVLTWAPHVNPLALAVPHSAAIGAAYLGMNVTIARPAGYDLAPRVMQLVETICRENGATLTITDHQRGACAEADVLYVKSWGATALYGDKEQQRAQFRALAGWCVGPEHLNDRAILMHCLPVRRNVVIADAALEGPQSVVIDQAENRLWTQAAILENLFSEADTHGPSTP